VTQAPFPPAGAPPAGSAAWDAADDALRRRVSAAGIGGGALFVVRGDEVLHETSVGGVDRTTALPVASAAKWLTAATLLTLVDDGTIALDEPIARWLPRFAPTMTLRHLLSHTAGIPEDDCLWNPHDTLAACVDRLATLPPRFAPGAAFAYGNSSFHVAGRLAEVASGRSFQALFADRIARPLGLTHTTVGGAANPCPAAGAITSADDYLRFMRMIASGGAGTLSASSVAELRRDQTAGHDTSRDYAVGITRIPTYGFGLWRDKVVADDRAVIISGNGGRGFYPWIDDETSTLGVLAVDDDRGAELAVPASRAVVDLAIAAVPRP
jgi:CubicO group peptidase (beta-lactamase class C family)